MKYLQDYITSKSNKLFDELGVFFAFSNEQFEEGIQKNLKRGFKKGLKYTRLFSGAFVPSENANLFIKKYDEIVKESVKEDIAENGIEKIICRELANYECYYTGDYTAAFEALKCYNVPIEKVRHLFYKNLPLVEL